MTRRVGQHVVAALVIADDIAKLRDAVGVGHGEPRKRPIGPRGLGLRRLCGRPAGLAVAHQDIVGQRRQGRPLVGRRERLEVRLRLGGELDRPLVRVVDRPVLRQQGADLLPPLGRERACLHHVGDERADRRIGAVHQGDHRQRDLAFAQVAGHGLSERLHRAGEVEQVVDQLEGDAELERRTRRAPRPRPRAAPPSMPPMRAHPLNR
ncbi:MAG: hypothetical protein MZV64_73610 [Ignavibacteriales bacterium]|nr:hypothetical protein [Ignavibacteriales bacterium]